MSHFYTGVDHFALLPAIILALFDSLLEARTRRWQPWKQGQVGPVTAVLISYR